MAAEITGRARELIAGPNFCQLATVMPDGTPQVTPVWVDVEGGTVLINTAEGRVKTENLRRNPKVGLAVSSHENPYEFVSIRGRVAGDTHDGADEHINKLTKKYLGQDEYPYRQSGEVRVIFKIEPQKVFTYGS